MSAKQMLRKLVRLERAIEIKYGKQKYKSTSRGMFEVPADEVLACLNGGYEGQIVRTLRYRNRQKFFEDFRKRLLGKNYIPSWELGREAKRKWHERLANAVREYNASLDDIENLKLKKKAATERLLKRRQKAERDSGRPVAFLLPFDPIVLQWQIGSKNNPRLDKRITAKDLAPIYGDGSVGNPKHYPISGPF